MASSDFGHMLSVGAIRFEDRFCSSKKGRWAGFQHGVPCTWQLPWLAVEKPWSALVGPFLTLLAQTGSETTPLPLYRHHFWTCRQHSVRWSMRWSESPDHWKLAYEWVWLGSWTQRDCVKEALAQVSSASSKQKLKYKPKKVSIAWKRLPVNSLR